MISCSKSENDEAASSEADLITALNKKDLPEASNLYDKLDGDFGADKKSYYSAQINSLEADIDIYSLFNIVKMELFEFAMTEWSNISRYNKVMQNQASDLLNSDEFERRSTVEELNEKIKELEAVNPLELEVQAKLVTAKKIERNSHLHCSYTVRVSEKNDTGIFTLSRFRYSEGVYESTECEELIEEALNNVDRLDELKYLLYDYKLQYLVDRRDGLKSSSDATKGLKFLMSLYQSAKIITNVPDIGEDRFKHVNLALEDLSKVLNSKSSRFKDNAKKQTALLSGYLILGALKDSIDFKGAKSPLDLICRLDATKIVTNYKYLLSGFKNLYNVMIDSEFSKKNEKSFKGFKKYLDLAPEMIAPDDKERHIESIQEYQENSSC